MINRKSPPNEVDYINSYKSLNSQANKRDSLDISAVKAIDGTPGHALLNQEINQRNDRERHRGTNFISDKELRKQMKK